MWSLKAHLAKSQASFCHRLVSIFFLPPVIVFCFYFGPHLDLNKQIRDIYVFSWVSTYQELEGWDPINWFNPAIFLSLS